MISTSRRARLAVVAALLLGAFPAQAVTLNGPLAIGKLGVQGDEAYFAVTPAGATGCLSAFFYVGLATPGGKARYAELVTAKTLGLSLGRVDYTLNVTTTKCTVDLLEIN